MKLDVLLQEIKKIGHEKTLFFMDVESIEGTLLVSDIMSQDYTFIVKLAQKVEFDYQKVNPVNQVPLLYHISFY